MNRQALADYAELPPDARAYMTMARAIDPKKADAMAHRLAENLRRLRAILGRIERRDPH